MTNRVRWYDTHAAAVMATYEQVSAESVHGWLRDLLPDDDATILDVGAGSGRDATWLAALGYDVVAVEPSAELRKRAVKRHSGSGVEWIDDQLPALAKLTRAGLSFDVILLSAVWMHLREEERPRAFRKLINLLKPGGLLAITLRDGPEEPSRGIHAVSAEEVELLARNHGAMVERHAEAKDQLGRNNIRWIQMAIRLPDDGTGALPLLRSIVLNDSKSSTYKLALLRTICRVADGAAGLAYAKGEHIAVPFGLIALYWLRLFKPLLRENLPQNPKNVGLRNLGFAKDAYRRLADVSHLDLRVGMRFSRDQSTVLHQALKDTSDTIQKMPANYITFQDGRRVFTVKRTGRRLQAPQVVLDKAYLSGFGEMMVPEHLWRSLQRFGVWIEPVIVAEWTRLIKGYAIGLGVPAEDSKIAPAMNWEDPTRDVKLARERALALSDTGQLTCVWSGRRLDRTNLAIDHCLPWTVWPCGDLWNLMPAHHRVNMNKRAFLPADVLMRTVQNEITNWWDSAYVVGNQGFSERFWLEAQSSLPSVRAEADTLDDVFDAVCLQRLRLRQDQQVQEWKGNR